jgi:hypothetical protein
MIPGLIEIYRISNELLYEGKEWFTLTDDNPIFPSLWEDFTEILTFWIEVAGISGESISNALSMAHRPNHKLSICASERVDSKWLVESCKGPRNCKTLAVEPLSLSKLVGDIEPSHLEVMVGGILDHFHRWIGHKEILIPIEGYFLSRWYSNHTLSFEISL